MWTSSERNCNAPAQAKGQQWKFLNLRVNSRARNEIACMANFIRNVKNSVRIFMHNCLVLAVPEGLSGIFLKRDGNRVWRTTLSNSCQVDDFFGSDLYCFQGYQQRNYEMEFSQTGVALDKVCISLFLKVVNPPQHSLITPQRTLSTQSGTNFPSA